MLNVAMDDEALLDAIDHVADALSSGNLLAHHDDSDEILRAVADENRPGCAAGVCNGPVTRIRGDGAPDYCESGAQIFALSTLNRP
jgi:hypothetical protein